MNSYGRRDSASQEKKQPKSNLAANEYLFFLPYVTLGLVLTIVFLLVFALLYVLFPFNPSAMDVMVKTITIAVIIIISYVAGKAAGLTGWFVGGSVGVIYMLCATLLGILTLSVNLFSVSPIWNLLAGFVLGAVGGMIGVGARPRRKKGMYIRRKGR